MEKNAHKQLAVKSNPLPLKRVMLVECARGAAAVYVLLHHVSIIGNLSGLFPWAKFLLYPLTFGTQAVHLFFFLSGFSIHYSSRSRTLNTLEGIKYYCYLRFRRIYPIFLVAVGGAVFLSGLIALLGISSSVNSLRELWNLPYILVFLSDFHPGSWFPGLANNPALWSLSYEFPYYLAYPIFWMCYRKIGIERTCAITGMISLLFILAGCIHANHLSNILSLYWMWTCGALMAEWKATNKYFSISPIAYYFILFLCYASSQSLEVISDPLIHGNLKGLTIGVVIFSTFAIFKPLLLPQRLLAAGGVAVLLLFSLLSTRHIPTLGQHIFLDARLVFAAGIIAMLLVTSIDIASLCRMLARPFLKTGVISYAVYVIHMPILYFTRDLLSHGGSSLGWLPLSIVPIVFLSWWLETKFQIRILRWLDFTFQRSATAA